MNSFFIALFFLFFNIHQTGVLTALPWLVPATVCTFCVHHAPCRFMQTTYSDVYIAADKVTCHCVLHPVQHKVAYWPLIGKSLYQLWPGHWSFLTGQLWQPHQDLIAEHDLLNTLMKKSLHSVLSKSSKLPLQVTSPCIRLCFVLDFLKIFCRRFQWGHSFFAGSQCLLGVAISYQIWLPWPYFKVTRVSKRQNFTVQIMASSYLRKFLTGMTANYVS